MKEQDLLNVAYRKKIIEDIKSRQNQDRQEKSLRDCDIYGGKIKPYVEKYQKSFFDQTTMDQMPVIATINVTRKIVDSKGTIYNELPERKFMNLSDDQKKVVEKIYSDNQSIFPQINKLYELQAQTHAYVYPEDGKLKIRPLKAHNLNAVPQEDNPEKALCYILSAFNKSQSNLYDVSTTTNLSIADQNDYKTKERFTLWSENLHFVFDGYGTIISEKTDNPIAPLMPIVDISGMKDFTYWKETDSTLSSFTVEFNSALSTLQQIVHMQGFAQAYLQGPESILPSSITVGPTKVLRLLTNPADQSEVTFGYAQPGSDLAGARAHIESILSMYLSSQGLDPKSISPSGEGAQKYSSGVERLLASIEKFEASKDACNTFSEAEGKIYQVIIAMLNAFQGSEFLDKNYKTAQIGETSMTVIFKRPDSAVSDTDKLDIVERKISMGIMTKQMAIEEIYNLNADEAEELLKEIENERYSRIDVNEVSDQTEDKPSEVPGQIA